jgi:hypothetical protein
LSPCFSDTIPSFANASHQKSGIWKDKVEASSTR